MAQTGLWLLVVGGVTGSLYWGHPSPGIPQSPVNITRLGVVHTGEGWRTSEGWRASEGCLWFIRCNYSGKTGMDGNKGLGAQCSGLVCSVVIFIVV